MGVFTARPTLSVELPAAATAARIELCSDRGCTKTLGTLDASARAGARARGRPSRDLPTGRVFWRARAVLAGNASGPLSPTWELWVRPGAPGVDTASLAFDDVDGDGHDDTLAPADTPVGDVNGDGFTDLVEVFCPNGKGACPARGLRLKWGSPSKVSVAQVLPVPEGADPKQPKWVDALGDVNGDGYADAALTYANPTTTWVLLGGPKGLALQSQEPTSAMGSADHDASQGGDLDGDGYSDYVAIPQFTYDPPHEAFVHLGGPKGLSPEPSLILKAPPDAGEYGSSVVARCDVNHDGFADVVIGAYRAPAGKKAGPGSVYVYFGAKTMSELTSQVIRAPEKERHSKAEAHFGISMAARDTNGDGACDLLVSTSCYMDDQKAGYCSGAHTWLFLGGPKGVQSEPSSEKTSPQ